MRGRKVKKSLKIFLWVMILASYGNDTRAFFNDVFPATNNAPALGQPGNLLPLLPMYEQARAQWDGGHVGRLGVNNPSDVNASVNVFRASSDNVVHEFDSIVSFNGTTGELLRSSDGQSLPAIIGGSFYGLHMGHFAGPVLRWLYFICGLAATTQDRVQQAQAPGDKEGLHFPARTLGQAYRQQAIGPEERGNGNHQPGHAGDVQHFHQARTAGITPRLCG